MAATKSDNLNTMRTPPTRGFCFPAIRQGYSRTCYGTVPLSDRRSYSRVNINVDMVSKNDYYNSMLNSKEEAVKQGEFRRWLESQGVEVSNGTNHLKLRYNGKRSVMPRHPGDEIKEPLRKAILKQLGLN